MTAAAPPVLDIAPLEDLSGYDTEERFIASRYRQGNRTVYSVDLTLAQIGSLLPTPDPSSPTEGNRRVREPHARSFGDYLRLNQDWISPSLLLRAPDMFRFERKTDAGGHMEFGILSFSRLLKEDLRILDGQHRVLGIQNALHKISQDLEQQRTALAVAKKGKEPAGAIRMIEGAIHALEEQRNRFAEERVSVQIIVEDDPVAYKQMFYDIADNALGITASVRARFDARKVTNRAIEDVRKHPLLKGRVDDEQDRIAGSNPNLMGVKHVADIVRTLTVGIDGRIGKRMETELSESDLIKRSGEFLDVLTSSFPDLKDLADDKITAEGVRSRSLLGSTTFVKALAGTYYELLQDEWAPKDIGMFFMTLNEHLEAPVAGNAIWIRKVADGVFTAGSQAPKARRQDMRRLVNSMVDWAKTQTPEKAKTPGRKIAARPKRKLSAAHKKALQDGRQRARELAKAA